MAQGSVLWKAPLLLLPALSLPHQAGVGQEQTVGRLAKGCTKLVGAVRVLSQAFFASGT